MRECALSHIRECTLSYIYVRETINEEVGHFIDIHNRSRHIVIYILFVAPTMAVMSIYHSLSI